MGVDRAMLRGAKNNTTRHGLKAARAIHLRMQDLYRFDPDR
jgi:hypothetical protein